MKTTDLMIGDWVMYGDEELQVLAMDDIAVYANKQRHGWIGYENLEPILLTDEILKKNGFELVGVGDNGPATPKANINRYEKWECKTIFQTFYLYYDRRSEYYSLNAFSNHINDIIYVHELQHAMRVCGIKKEIEL